MKLSLCCLSFCGFIWSNTIEMGGFGKNTCFSDEIQYPYEGLCNSLSHLCQGKGRISDIPQLLQCTDRVIQDNPHWFSTEPESTVKGGNKSIYSQKSLSSMFQHIVKCAKAILTSKREESSRVYSRPFREGIVKGFLYHGAHPEIWICS